MRLSRKGSEVYSIEVPKSPEKWVTVPEPSELCSSVCKLEGSRSAVAMPTHTQ